MAAQPTVGEIMTTGIKTLRSDQVLLEALTFMRKERVRHIPILKEGRLVGVVTDRDIKRATPTPLLLGRQGAWEQVVQETPLDGVMTRDPITASPAMTLAEALHIFIEKRVGCLPVLEGDRLVGIVTAQDLLRAMLQVLES